MVKQLPRALLFDIFGTSVDWRSTVTNSLNDAAHKTLNSATASIPSSVRIKASRMSKKDWGQFAQQWRNTYAQFTFSLATNSALKWKTVDEHHHDSLKELLTQWELEGLWTLEEVRAISLVWHHLNPWPDSENGIKALNT